MNVQKRVKQIVSYTVDDCIKMGYLSFEKPKKEMVRQITKELLQDQATEDMTVAELSIKVLSKIDFLELLDLDYIFTTFADDKKMQEAKNITVSYENRPSEEVIYENR